ncbi:MAG: hypothetical protein GTO63_14420 [Anaerolineae bacterium]|nr:hypothetical protein [Anaerolineae bacterium]NIN96042.1 hypothetical protein [Anaerolineae bacterium]NIQ79072.1 hypothetical protein [Anaerolineae bacterium]
MARLGQVLREARQRKAYSFREIEQATGLWPEYIKALETEDFHGFASVAHVRSSLRLYARFLGLNVKHVFALWEEALAEQTSIRQETTATSISPLYAALIKGLLVCFAVLLFATGLVGGYRWLATRQSADATPPMIGPGETPGPPSARSTPSPTPYSPISSTAVPRYTITVTLDYQGHHLDVEERIDYANRTDESLQDVVLNVFPNHDPDVFTLNSLSLEFGAGPMVPNHTLEDMTLRVPLPQQLAPGQVATIFLDFALDLPYIDPTASFTTGTLGWSERAVDVGHWYPALAPFLPGEGWYTFSYHRVGDPYVMEEADYEIQIHAPDGVTVAGSGSEERDGNTWRYSMSQARSFAFAASDQYLTHSTEIDGITVISYHFPGHADAGVEVARVAAEALQTYGDQFGVRYPYLEYRVAEAEFAGGMEFSGLSFLGSLWYATYPGGVRCQLVSLLVHEVSHQWWYGLVGNDQVREPWLDEALATYSGLLFYKLWYPDDHQWAWEFEVLNYQPSGPINATIYDFDDQAAYMNAVYRHGALFLADLRNVMGDETFYAFLRDYCQSQRHTISATEDFFSVASRHTSHDLNPLLDEYFTSEEGEGQQ